MSDLHVQAVLLGLQNAPAAGRERRRPPAIPSVDQPSGVGEEAAGVRPRVLVMLVGLWRAYQCGRASQMAHLIQANPSYAFSFVVCTDPNPDARCSQKDLDQRHTGETDSHTAVGSGAVAESRATPGEGLAMGKPAAGACSAQLNASAIRSWYPAARVVLASTADFGKYPDYGNLFGNGGPFRRRLQHCLDRLRPSSLSTYDVLVVLRPDVVLNRPLVLPHPLQPAFSILLGSARRACVFSDRDIDFGYMAVPPVSLRTWLRDFNTTLPSKVPSLPTGFEGVWPHGEQRASETAPHMMRRCRGNGTAVFANKMIELAASGSPLTAAHATEWAKGVFLSIVREGRRERPWGTCPKANSVSRRT